jgi:hypothetical protein
VTAARRALVVGGSLLGVLLVVRVVAVVAVLGSGLDDWTSILGGDTRRYLAILTTPGTPYRDFPVEYPPVVLGFTWFLQGADLYTAFVRLVLSQLALELATAGLLAWGWGRRAGLAFLVLGTPMLFFPFPYLRIDLVPVVLAVAGLALVKRRWPTLGGAALGVALLAKVWPLVVLPVLAVRRQWRALAATAVVGGLGLAAWVAWAGTEGPRQVATFRGADGWQIESVVGVLVHLADPGATLVEQGAWRTGAAVPGVVRLALPILALGVAAAAWLLAERRRQAGDPRTDVLVDGWAPLAGVLALLVCSSIISPQYLLWATPFAAIAVADPRLGVAWPRRGPWPAGTRPALALALLFLVAATLSTVGLAGIHPLVRGELWAGLVVVGRNVALMAMLGLCLAVLARPHRRAESEVDPGAEAATGSAPQPTPTAMMARMSEIDATRSIDDVSRGMP